MFKFPIFFEGAYLIFVKKFSTHALSALMNWAGFYIVPTPRIERGSRCWGCLVCQPLYVPSTGIEPVSGR